MKIILTLIALIFLGTNIQAQSKSLLNMGNGDIMICSENCCLTHFGTFPVFGDIAYGNDKIYAISDRLYVIDFISKQMTNSFILYDVNGNQIGGNGLEIVNDSLLFFENDTKLYSFNLQNNSTQLMGNIGYYCSGDLLFITNSLYMTTNSGELIAISLNSSYSVSNVLVIDSDSISINSAYGLSKKIDPHKILLYNGSIIYEFDTVLGEYNKICELDGTVNGATFYEASVSESNFPNIITPNNDNINDYMDLSEFSKFSIVNRWGEEVFNSSIMSIWRGENKNGDPLTEGVYFILVHFEECGQEKYFSKPITIMK